jgi:hypothetical protein
VPAGGVDVEPGVGVVGVLDGVTAFGDGVVDAGTNGVVADGEVVDPRGFGCAPGCESECEASRIATLSNATVNVTRRLNRITSTRNALVCTV